jgi:hypothetical protein
VVDNPVDLSKAFCLPLGILSVAWKVDPETKYYDGKITFDTIEKGKEAPEFIQRSIDASLAANTAVQREVELLRQELDLMKADKMAVEEQKKEAVRKQELEKRRATTLQSLDLQQWEVPSRTVEFVKVIGQGVYGDVQLVVHAGITMAFKPIRAAGSQDADQQVKATLKEAAAL